MRGLFFSLMFLIFSGAAYGSTCEEIRQNLALIEAKLQSEKMPRCDEKQEKANQKNCCDPDDPELTCSTFLELQNKHNHLLGKLVIYEGLISIGRSLEADYRTIQNLKPEQVQEVKKSMDSFFQSFAKASLIDSSMESEFWFDKDGYTFEGENPADLLVHIQKQCSRTDEKLEKFCATLSRYKDSEDIEYDEVMNTLSGFAAAHQNVGISKADKLLEYKNFRKTLELKIGDKKIPYDLSAPEIKKLSELREIFKHPSDAIPAEKAKKAAKIAKELDGLKANYGAHVSANTNFADFFDSTIRNEVSGFHHVSRALMGKAKNIENLDGLVTAIENREKASKYVIAKNIEKNTDCAGGQEEILQCFRDRRPASDGREEARLATYEAQLHSLKDFKSLAQKARDAQACAERSGSAEETRKCVSEIKKALNLSSKDEVEELRKQLAEVEIAMDNMNRAENIDNLKLSKAMGLKALGAKGCFDREKMAKVTSFKATCEGSSLDDYSQTIVSLSEETGAILDFTSNPYLNKNLDTNAQSMEAYRKLFLQRCADKKADLNLCEIYKSDEAASGMISRRIAQARRTFLASRSKNKRVPAKADFSEVEETDGAGAFAAGFATTMITRGVPWYMQYEARNSNHKRMMSYHNQRLSFLKAQNEYWKAHPTIPVYYHPYMNYGYSQYDYGSASSFGGSGAPNLYKSSHDFTQFNFAPPMVMDQYGGQSGSTGAPAGFNFAP